MCPFGVPSRFQTSTRFGSVEYCSILLIKFKQESEIEWIVEGILMYTSFIEDPENKATQMCNYLISSCIRALLRGRGRPKSNVNKQYTVADLLAKWALSPQAWFYCLTYILLRFQSMLCRAEELVEMMQPELAEKFFVKALHMEPNNTQGKLLWACKCECGYNNKQLAL